MNAIETYQLTRVFGERVAVEDLTLNIPEGAVFGFLGPNGAGKTTTIAIAAMIAVSSRVNDPRTAQQYSAWAVIPFMILFFGQLFGLIALGTLFALTVFVVLIPLAVFALWVATRLFQREVILTRWK